MSCTEKAAKTITNTCDDIPRAGLEKIAWAINRADIDTVTYDGTIENLVTAITLNSGTYAYAVTAVKKEANAGFDLETGDDVPDTFLNYFAFKPYEQDAESIQNIDQMQDLVIIAELKGDKTEGCFLIYGLENGLYKTSGSLRQLDNHGFPIYEFGSEEGQGERYSRFVYWDTDYSTTKAAIELLTLNYGPELHTLSNAAADPNGTEADATTGFTPVSLSGTGSNVFQSQSSVVNTGSYAIEASSNDTPTNGAKFYIDLYAAPYNLIDGDECKIEFDICHVGTGGDWRGSFGNTASTPTTNITTNITASDTTFQHFSSEFTMTTSFRYVLITEAGPGNNGGVYFDNLSVKKKL